MYTVEDQCELEIKYKLEAEKVYRERLERQREYYSITREAVGTALKKSFIDTFSINIRNWLIEELKPKRGVQKQYRKILLKMHEVWGEKETVLSLCTVTLEHTLNRVMALGKQSPSISSIGYLIGKVLFHEAQLEAFLQQEQGKYQENRIQAGLDKRQTEWKKQKHLENIMNKFEFHWSEKEKKELMALGATLVNILVESTDMLETIPINRTGTVVVATDTLMATYKENAEFMAKFIFTPIPMIIKPKPWTGLKEGGYYGVLQRHTSFIRINHLIGRTKLVKSYIKKLNEVDLTEIMGAVNKIQETPYRINQELLKVIDQIMLEGGKKAGLEDFEPIESKPQGRNELDKTYKQRVYDEKQQEIARKSKALRAIRIVSIAKQFKDYPEIFFPCNIDFRGRIYPISTFNHQGDDLMKALVEYANPVECTNINDIDLLEIQGCNLFGNDKISLPDRIAWTQEHKEQILMSAEAPLDFDWWETADEPLQFLAFCLEYKKALEFISKNNTIIGFKCNIPIAYDGTCSGLQHYSAMLHDEIGGSAVNLIDHDVPADIYGQVAEKVKKVVERDAINGTADIINKEESGGGHNIKFGSKHLAQTWLAYGITRKVCKRPVMTLAYGSGQYGFQEQLYEDITKHAPEFDTIQRPCAKYLAKIIWDSVQTTVVSATEGMKYLKALAKELIDAGLPVNWWTPLGLPVQQQYLKTIQKSFRTRFGAKMSMPLYYTEVDPNEHLDCNAQKNGIAPNFIHSLDSTHLMMTVNEANLVNYTTIHDSFGTSLGEARTLQKVIREQLYKLYTEHTPMEQFKKYVEEQLGRPVMVEPPTQGHLDLKNILTSKFIFH